MRDDRALRLIRKLSTEVQMRGNDVWIGGRNGKE